jgi:hypothetical protein
MSRGKENRNCFYLLIHYDPVLLKNKIYKSGGLSFQFHKYLEA